MLSSHGSFAVRYNPFRNRYLLTSLVAVTAVIPIWRTLDRPHLKEASDRNLPHRAPSIEVINQSGDAARNHASAATTPGSASIPPLFASPGKTSGRPARQARVANALADGGLEPLGRTAPVAAESLVSLNKLHSGDSIEIPLFDGDTARGILHLSQADAQGWTRIAGKLQAPHEGSFVFASRSPEKISGQVLLPKEKVAIQLGPDRNGNLQLRERRIEEVLCHRYEIASHDLAQTLESPRPEPASSVVPPYLSSRPTATAVLYLDFDGERVIDPVWNAGERIEAKPSGLTAEEMTEVWQAVKEDYLPFNVDVTTSASRYYSAPVGQRMRCIITTSNAWYVDNPYITGVAYNNSFRGAGQGWYAAEMPCWVFTTFQHTPALVAQAASHEIGHTLGLNHDGRGSGWALEDYFYGYPARLGGWSPIMGGAAPGVTMFQWSKGEYRDASNQEDDLAIIAGSANGFGFSPDEAADSLPEASPLHTSGNIVHQSGVIGADADLDTFVFTITGGDIQIDATPAAGSPNLDISLRVYDAQAQLIASSEPSGQLNAAVAATLPAGTYYLQIAGSGDEDGVDSGYTAYGSLGAYTITGTIGGIVPRPVLVTETTLSGWINTPFEHHLAVDHGPVTFAVEGPLPPGLVLNPSTGAISGIPTTSGRFHTIVTVSNNAGADQRTLEFQIAPASIALGEILKSVSDRQTGSNRDQLIWTSGGSAPWFAQAAISQSTFSAQSGSVKDGGESWLQTTITGPAELSFSQRTSSEEGYDALIFTINGEERDRFSGLTNWKVETYNIPAGQHVLRWTYRKDGTGNDGKDCAWLANVALLGAPELPPTRNAQAQVGVPIELPFEYRGKAGTIEIQGTLPAGVSLSDTKQALTGIPETDGTFPVQVIVRNEFGEASQQLTLHISAQFEHQVLGQALGEPAREWNTSAGAAAWTIAPASPEDKFKYVQSGDIEDGGESFLETRFEGPRIIGFSWKVSSQSKHDVFYCLLDDRVRASISGEGDWKEHYLYIPEGTHKVRWTYRKDRNGTEGADRAWLAEVRTEAAPLRVSTRGKGTVSRDVAGTTLQAPGSTILVQAVPHAGWIFKGWSGSIVSSSPKLRFPMQEGLELVANFEPATAQPDFEGKYQGSLRFEDATFSTEGYCSLQVSASGLFTGYVVVDGRRKGLKGAFDETGRFVGTMPGFGTFYPFIVDLHLEKDAEGVAYVAGALYTDVEFSGTVADVRLERSPFSSTKPCAFAGQYTAVLSPANWQDATSPRGSGFAVIRVSEEGVLRMVGRLADGSVLDYTTLVQSNGSWSMDRALYHNHGSLRGSVELESGMPPELVGLTGTLEWYKQWRENSTGAYRRGFFTRVRLIGAPYRIPAKGAPILSWFTGPDNPPSSAVLYGSFGNGNFALSYGSLPSNQTFRANFAPDNRVDIRPHSWKTELVMQPRSGLFRGSFEHPLSKKRVRVQGALIQRKEFGSGYFSDDQLSGQILISPELLR